MTAAEARRLVNQHLGKADEDLEPDEEDEDLPEDSSVVDEEDDLMDRLEAEGVASDIVDAVEEYVRMDDVAKALDVEHVDPELARGLQANESVLKEQIEEEEDRKDAIAESVAEGDAEVPLNEATGLYSDEEDV